MTTDPNTSQDRATPPPAVYVDKLTFRYRTQDDEPGSKAIDLPIAIEDISFSLPASELMIIAGPSGCGKSTLLKSLNGLIPHSYSGVLEGEIKLQGRSTAGLSLRAPASTWRLVPLILVWSTI